MKKYFIHIFLIASLALAIISIKNMETVSTVSIKKNSSAIQLAELSR